VCLKKYIGASSEFWADLQVLHDSSVYWDDEGLTREGKRRVGGLLDGRKLLLALGKVKRI
jgi:hypothetical protein